MNPEEGDTEATDKSKAITAKPADSESDSVIVPDDMIALLANRREDVDHQSDK